MPAPVVTFYENDGAGGHTGIQMNGSNPLAYGSHDAGSSDVVPTSGNQFPYWAFNDVDGAASSSDMTSVSLTIKNTSGGDTGEIIEGTPGNGNQPWMECKSVGASGCTPDSQSSYTTIGGSSNTLSVGDIGSTQGRQLYLRGDVPADATPGSVDFLFRVQYSYS